jgi:hypothetical protein
MSGKSSELLKRLASKEKPEEVSNLDIFKKEWLTLKEASELINMSDRHVRSIIEVERMDSRLFVGGGFGKRPTRCVRKEQFMGWFQGSADKGSGQANMQPHIEEAVS